MALQGIGYAGIASPLDSPKNNDFEAYGNGIKEKSQPISRVNAQSVSESYSSKSFAFEYTSKDGDKVTFSYDSVEYQKTMMNIDASGKPEDIKKLISYIKDQYQKMKLDIINNFIKGNGGKVEEDQETSGSKELNIPQYWNAENTSQRIVDFATSFYGAFEGQGSEFLSTIKAAIEDGFKQAQDLLGDLPDEVSGLIGDTYNMVMQKLDAWAGEQGITVDNAAV